MPHYCDSAPNHPIHAAYHNTEYGFPVRDESVIFERLALEIMQAGLSWEITLKKRVALQRAFHNYCLESLIKMTENDIARLLNDETIIRNRRKIEAIISNARVVMAMRDKGGFAVWLDARAQENGQDLSGWTKLFKKTFRFTGTEIVKEFLMSLGYLEGAHRPDCPIYAIIQERRKENVTPKPAF